MKYLKVVLPIFVLVLVAGNVFAAPPGGRLFLQTPEERAQQWQDSFSKFVAEHPELTFEKIQALDDMARITDRSFFVQAPAKEKRDMLSARLADLGRVLSAYDYQQLLASSPKELVRWMKDAEVITDPSITPNCNCGDAQDCAGGSCQNVTCVHEAGTTHWGRC
jgi:hypothetical protein